MALVTLRARGLARLEQDLHHLSWIVVNMKKKESDGDAVVALQRVFSEVVLQFLAMQDFSEGQLERRLGTGGAVLQHRRCILGLL